MMFFSLFSILILAMLKILFIMALIMSIGLLHNRIESSIIISLQGSIVYLFDSQQELMCDHVVVSQTENSDHTIKFFQSFLFLLQLHTHVFILILIITKFFNHRILIFQTFIENIIFLLLFLSQFFIK